jgi:hypothetical protein
MGHPHLVLGIMGTENGHLASGIIKLYEEGLRDISKES